MYPDCPNSNRTLECDCVRMRWHVAPRTHSTRENKYSQNTHFAISYFLNCRCRIYFFQFNKFPLFFLSTAGLSQSRALHSIECTCISKCKMPWNSCVTRKREQANSEPLPCWCTTPIVVFVMFTRVFNVYLPSNCTPHWRTESSFEYL